MEMELQGLGGIVLPAKSYRNNVDRSSSDPTMMMDDVSLTLRSEPYSHPINTVTQSQQMQPLTVNK